MRRIALYLTICLLLIAVPLSASAQPYPEELIHKAMDLEREKKLDEAIALLKPEAESGDIWAGFFLALMYEERGVSGDDELAVSWYLKGAEAGHGKSQALLGDMYRWGKGVGISPSQAEAWYRKSLDQEIPEAERGLAILIAEDKASTSDIREAVRLFRTASSEGDEQAEFWLNSMILVPDGPDKDRFDARYETALCYLAILHTRFMVEDDEAWFEGGQFVIGSKAPLGCKVNWLWTDADHKWMVENLEPFLRNARSALVKAGFKTLPKKLDITVDSKSEHCLKPTGTPKLLQEGPDLVIRNISQDEMRGAIVQNHIVLVQGINLNREYSQYNGSIYLLHGDWIGNQAVLTNTTGNCTITLKARKAK